MEHLSIDIETYSSVDIKKSGMYKYVQSPDFEILLFAFSYDNAPVRILDMTKESIPAVLIADLMDPAIIKHAYNAPFEWYCLSKFLRQLGYNLDPAAWLSQWRCTMLHGLYCGYTAGLGATGDALGLPQDKKKLGIGMSLIRTFCIPVKPTKTNGNRTRILSKHEPEKWELFKTYCKQDVITEMEIERRLASFPVPAEEQLLWELDQRINAFGVHVDEELVCAALAVSDTSTTELLEEAVKISGLDNPKSVQQLSKWLQEEMEEEVEDLRKETVKGLLSGDIDSDDARRMLEIRQELSKTSVKKYTAMYEAVCSDGRIRGLLQFYGANRTGRWAGRLVQVQNLPKNYLETLSLARELVRKGSIETVKLIYGNVPDTLSQLIRTAFIPSDGHIFLVADFSAIEARVIAWLADESWRQEVFMTHGKIYEASASAMFGVPIEKITKGNPEYALRAKGKVAELALGYQGASGALITMGALKMGLTEEELPEIVKRWRAANKRIVDLWYAVEAAALSVMETGNAVGFPHGLVFAREGDYQTGQDFLTITLPSGRKLFYVRPFLSANQWGNPSIHYTGMDQKTKRWAQLDTYGGKLVENIVQAIARDCLAVAMQRLETNGFQIVMHVHDEAILDDPLRSGDRAVDETILKDAVDIMGQAISWAPGLLLRADGFVTEFYRKEG